MSDTPARGEQKVFIDEHVRILVEEEAGRRIDERVSAESSLIDDTEGLSRVPKERWQEAQRYEQRTWMDQGRDLQTDRNDYHRERFGEYAALHGKRFSRAIELGCGPFTNMRLIMRECAVGEIVLLDPLIEQYLAHPYCQYRTLHLGGAKRLLGDTVKRKGTNRGLRHVLNVMASEGLRGRRVKIIPSMIEECPPVGCFDLVVMINVIEHCQDAEAVFRKIMDLSRPGTMLVFGDILYDPLSFREQMRRLYDVGHPLRVAPQYVEGLLAKHFSEVYCRKEPIVREFCGVPADHQEIYFIGIRR